MNPILNPIRYALLTLVAASLATWGVRTFRAVPAAGGGVVLPADGLVVVNFHAAIQCNGCREIDRETQTVMESEFSDALKSGRISHAVINYEDPANKHFIQDYGLSTSTVVVTRRRNGRDAAWQRLDAVWNHLYDDPAMRAYLKAHINQFMEP